MGDRTSEGGVQRIGERYHEGLIVLVDDVVGYGNRYVVGSFTGGIGQGPGSQGIVCSTFDGRPAGHDVIHGNGLAGLQ